MSTEHDRRAVQALLDRYGRTYARQAGFTVKNTPSPLFRLLCLSVLLSARIGADIAVAAARALSDHGWTTADKLAGSTWKQRTRALNRSGYARYDERTATMLGDTAELVVDRWNGDLRNLRDEAGQDPAAERRLLRKCKGLGDVGVDIFFREVQLAWDELFPFADQRVLEVAGTLDLGDEPDALAGHVARDDYPRLLAALFRAQQEGDPEEVVGSLVDAA